MNKSLMTLYPLTEIYTQPFILQAMLPLPRVKKSFLPPINMAGKEGGSLVSGSPMLWLTS
jgi:hypothetical protein